MSHNHYREECKYCSDVLSQCRCTSPTKTVIRKATCEKCASVFNEESWKESIDRKRNEALKSLGYFQGTSDPEKDKGDKENLTDQERKDRDTRKHVLFQNYDYTSEGPNETSPGGGLYHGPMDKYKSVKDFLDKRRSDNKKLDRNSQTRMAALDELYKITEGK